MSLTVGCFGSDPSEPQSEEHCDDEIDDPVPDAGDGDDDDDGDDDGGDEDTDDGDDDGDDDDDDDDDDGDDDGDDDDEPGADDDGDGVPNHLDNCPNIANPNQLDFNNNGAGNVCDPLFFTTGGGTLHTTATASAGQGSCDIPLPLQVLGGEVRVLLDDDAAIADLEFVAFDLADVPKKDCKLAVVPIFAVINATLALSNFGIVNGGGAYPTSLPHNLGDHDNGLVAGTQHPAHPIQVLGTLSASTGPNNPPTNNAIDFPGKTPPAAVLVSNAGGKLELVFNDANFVIINHSIDSDDLPVTVNLLMKGLVGTLNLTP